MTSWVLTAVYVCVRACVLFVQLWDASVSASSNRLLAVLGAVNNFNIAVGHMAAVTALATPSTGVLVSGANDGYLLVWNQNTTATGIQFTVSRNVYLGSTAIQPTCIAVLASARQDVAAAIVAVGYNDGKVRMVQWSTGTVMATLAAHSQPVFSLTVLPERTLVTGGADGTITLWETYTYSKWWASITVSACFCVCICVHVRVGERWRSCAEVATCCLWHVTIARGAAPMG